MRYRGGIRSIDDLQQCLQDIAGGGSSKERPFILISYAQSIDGSIAEGDRRSLKISGPSAMLLTHQLRALFDAILVGIDTVLADDPQLTVRLVPGNSPRPVVLDTHLRIPLESRLMQHADHPSWLASAASNSGARAGAIRAAGATILPCGLDANGLIDIRHLMGMLHDRGIRSLMVEGGAKVITSFIRAELADLLVITISPTLIGGLRVVHALPSAPLPRFNLTQVHYERRDDDMILWARPVWNPP
jgi:riboflavin-specific deaminase-like protein